MGSTINNETSDVVQTSGLGKQYGSAWALKDCTIGVPSGSISALVGPNGSGKTTLLKLLATLSWPSTGTVTVLGQTPAQTVDYLSRIGYSAQETPLYARLSAQDHFAIVAHMDLHWDNEMAIKRLSELKIPLDRPVGTLSGGQRAQVSLAMALAKKPQLLLLDEPVAALDPLARVDFLQSLAQAVADAAGGLTAIMSSHLLADLESVCDQVIILASGKTQLCDSIEHVLQTHKLLVGPPGKPPTSEGYTIIRESGSSSAAHILVRLDQPKFSAPGWHVRDVDVQDIVLAYMGQGRDESTSDGGAR
jgi:ABC-2 type transport system ATP-binding protein